MLDIAKYSFVNAKIRAMLSFLLSPEQCSRLSSAKDIHECMGVLHDTPYASLASAFEKGDYDLWGMEKELLKNDLAAYRKILTTLASKPEKELVSLFMQTYELEDLKTVLRIWHKKAPVAVEDYILGEKIIHDIDFKKIVSAPHLEEIILLLDHTPYKKPLLAKRDTLKEKGSVFALETALDMDYYQRLLACIDRFSSLDKKISRRILGVAIDIENINWLIRGRKYYSLGAGDMLELIIPGGERINKETVRSVYTTNGLTKIVDSLAFGPYAKIKDLVSENIALVESFLYEILLSEIKRGLAGFPFTIGTVLGYLILKHRETKIIISLLNAKQYGISKDTAVSLLGM